MSAIQMIKERKGIYTIEVCMLFAAVAIAATAMATYVRRSFRAKVYTTEKSLNEAMYDPRRPQN